MQKIWENRNEILLKTNWALVKLNKKCLKVNDDIDTVLPNMLILIFIIES